MQSKTIQAYNRSAENFAASIAKLSNYNHPYDFLLGKLNDGDTILDLACGPAQISKYLVERKKIKIVGVDLSEQMLKIAQKNIPEGTFYHHSIIDYHSIQKFDSVVIGFGIPYLKYDQAAECIKNSVSLIKDNGFLYISFMHGDKEGYEQTSFGGNNQFYIYYHDKARIRDLILSCGLHIVKDYFLDYIEPDGKITEDVVLIAQK